MGRYRRQDAEHGAAHAERTRGLQGVLERRRRPGRTAAPQPRRPPARPWAAQPELVTQPGAWSTVWSMSPWEARAASCGAAQAPLWTRWLVLAAVATDGTLVVLACARHLLVRVACFSAGRRRRRRRRCVGSRRRRRQPERWRVLGHPLLLLATLRLVKDNEHLRRSLHPHARPHPPHQHAVAHLQVDVRHHVLSRHLGGLRAQTPSS